jgi:hypothetical protein
MTDLEAVNRALTLIAVEPIGSLSDNTKVARTMNALKAGTKKIVLTEFPWSFAMRIIKLSPGGGTPPSSYSHAFTYPSDCLAVRRLYGGTDFRGVAEFRVLYSGSTLFIAANISAGEIEYIAHIENLDIWPMQIQECFVTRLASDAASALTGSPQMASALLEKYIALARSASQTSVAEENIPPGRAADYVRVRQE